MKNLSHDQKVKEISEKLRQYSVSHDKRKVRFSHGGTNSTRVQDKSQNYIIDISDLNEILEIDKDKKIAIVEPNVPMDRLAEECLRFGLIPKVVMEFPAITCGGAVNGAALEASSYKYGQFNDTCLEYECILADGSIIKANQSENTDLFYGISGSYGSLALLTSLSISLLPAKSYVSVELLHIETKNVVSKLQDLMKKNAYEYIDAIIYTPDESVIVLGKFTDTLVGDVVTFTEKTDEWFYLYVEQSVKHESKRKFTVPLLDFLFRYDRGAFWTGKYSFDMFHMPFTRLMRTVLDPLMHTKVMYKALHRSNSAQDVFIQDYYIPLSKTNDFIDFTNKALGIYPLWLCPIKPTTTPQYLSPHYLNEDMLIDVGVWGKIPKNKNILEMNKAFEVYVEKLGGRKMLYAEAFYTEDVFWKIYDKKEYLNLRSKYKAGNVFPDVWEKTSVKKRYPMNKWKGVLQTIGEMIKDKYF